MSPRYWIILVIGISFVLTMPDVEGFEKDIGIDISTKCKLMIKNNLTTICPSIQQILTLFPDTSPRHQVGDFEVIDGVLIRGPPQYEIDHYNKYMKGLEDEPRIWINPPGAARTYMKMITIESNFNEYPIQTSYVMPNNTISVGVDRYANKACNDIILNADGWITNLGDTIVWLQYNCDPEKTNLETIKKYYYEKSYQDIRTSYKYKLEKWIVESKIKCLGICKEY